MPEDNENLMGDIKDSIKNMQDQMQDTYQSLSDLRVTGKSNDGTVTITMYANYTFGDIDFDQRALKDGVKEFKWRIREAWKNVTEEIQKTTQEKTMELLQGMEIPDEIRDMSLEDKSDDDD